MHDSRNNYRIVPIVYLAIYIRRNDSAALEIMRAEKNTQVSTVLRAAETWAFPQFLSPAGTMLLLSGPTRECESNVIYMGPGRAHSIDTSSAPAELSAALLNFGLLYRTYIMHQLTVKPGTLGFLVGLAYEPLHSLPYASAHGQLLPLPTQERLHRTWAVRIREEHTLPTLPPVSPLAHLLPREGGRGELVPTR